MKKLLALVVLVITLLVSFMLLALREFIEPLMDIRILIGLVAFCLFNVLLILLKSLSDT